MRTKIYNEESNKDAVIISFFDGVKEDRLRFLEYKTYSIVARNWSVFKQIDEYTNFCRDIVIKENWCKKFIFVGICKLSNLALEISIRLGNLFKDKDIIVVGAPFCFDCNGTESPRNIDGTKLSPALEVFSKDVKNRLVLKKYGDASVIASKLNKIKGYQFIFYNKNWRIDIDNWNRLSDKLIHSFRFDINDNIDNSNTHAYLVHYLKENIEDAKILFERIKNLS